TGNTIIHKLTTDGRTYLFRVELKSFEDKFIYAEYSNFSVGAESDNYTTRNRICAGSTGIISG
ncbi:hypothetical protein LSH36_3029g00003, partial [Paralvinella palmiformis]